MTTPIDLDALRPADTPAFMTPAWLGCISYALKTPEIWDAFIADTGIVYAPPRSPLDRMIDDATDAQRAVLVAFIRWANVRVWGPIDRPAPPTT